MKRSILPLSILLILQLSAVLAQTTEFNKPKEAALSLLDPGTQNYDVIAAETAWKEVDGQLEAVTYFSEAKFFTVLKVHRNGAQSSVRGFLELETGGPSSGPYQLGFVRILALRAKASENDKGVNIPASFSFRRPTRDNTASLVKLEISMSDRKIVELADADIWEFEGVFNNGRLGKLQIPKDARAAELIRQMVSP